MDDLQRVIDALDDKEVEVRQEAVASLRNWIAAGRDNDYKLFSLLQPAYSSDDAKTVMDLLHVFSPEEAADQKTHELLLKQLTHPKVAIRELAHSHLIGLFPAGRTISFNAAAAAPHLNQMVAEWRKLVQQSKK